VFTHWGFRWGLSLCYLTAPLFLIWWYPMGPFYNRLYKRQRTREKTYDMVRMKDQSEVQVMTDDAQQVYNRIEEIGHPIPMYHRFPTTDEIKKYNLKVIGLN
jgi:hypothetical protein